MKVHQDGVGRLLVGGAKGISQYETSALPRRGKRERGADFGFGVMLASRRKGRMMMLPLVEKR